METETRPCDECGLLVTKSTKWAASRQYWTCGKRCAALIRVKAGHVASTWQGNSYRSQRAARPCVVCGEMTRVRYITEANHDKPWYCSRECGRSVLNRGGNPRRGQEIPCEVCGQLFYMAKERIQNGRRFCGRACADIGHRKATAIKACLTCGAEMRLQPSVVAKQYCSMACRNKGRYKNQIDRMHNGKPARYDNWGYVMLWEPTHPNAKANGWIHEHRYVMANHLGRKLEPHEEVDHKDNTARHDNRLENLQLLNRSDHRRKTGEDRRQAKAALLERVAEAEAKAAAARAESAAEIAALKAELKALRNPPPTTASS